MADARSLESLSPEERLAFCREVLERLSELVDGEAPADFRARVETILGDCGPYLAFRRTLEATVRAVGARREDPDLVDEGRFRSCVERVRRALAASA